MCWVLCIQEKSFSAQRNKGNFYYNPKDIARILCLRAAYIGLLAIAGIEKTTKTYISMQTYSCSNTSSGLRFSIFFCA
jgi:hypothetical protein